ETAQWGFDRHVVRWTRRAHLPVWACGLDGVARPRRDLAVAANVAGQSDGRSRLGRAGDVEGDAAGDDVHLARVRNVVEGGDQESGRSAVTGEFREMEAGA